MKLVVWTLYLKASSLLNREEGQNLVEYALLIALIALAATVGLIYLGKEINFAYFNIL